MNFEELKEEILKRAKKAGACKGQYQRAAEATTIDELIEVLKDNLNFAKNNDILTIELSKQYERPELFNVGKENSGFFNSGDRNSGDRNSGDRNSGYRNSGDRNSGDLNSGYRNSGDLNSGDRNSGYRNSGDLNSGYRNSGYRNSGDRNSGDRNSGDLNSGDRNSGDLNSGDRNSGDLNSGYRNSGDRNSGDRNSGYRNSGDLNSGDLNSGYRNSGDLNSGYRNSGVFCTKKREDTVPFFNKESGMTWDEWYNHQAYDITRALQITEWIYWDSMTEDEKKEYPKAFVTGGRLKVYEYKQAWANLWETLSDREKEIVKSLPNFDNEVFFEITGIRL